jgi:hypothetical protein
VVWLPPDDPPACGLGWRAGEARRPRRGSTRAGEGRARGARVASRGACVCRWVGSRIEKEEGRAFARGGAMTRRVCAERAAPTIARSTGRRPGRGRPARRNEKKKRKMRAPRPTRSALARRPLHARRVACVWCARPWMARLGRRMAQRVAAQRVFCFGRARGEERRDSSPLSQINQNVSLVLPTRPASPRRAGERGRAATERAHLHTHALARPRAGLARGTRRKGPSKRAGEGWRRDSLSVLRAALFLSLCLSLCVPRALSRGMGMRQGGSVEVLPRGRGKGS